MSAEFLTQEVGSLAKPDWRIHAIQGRPLNETDLAGAYAWAGRLGIEPDTVSEILEKASIDKDAVRDLAAEFAIRLQETAGLDIIYDGEQDRSEMYQHAIQHTDGFAWRGRVRAFDNKSYKKAACVDTPAITGFWHEDEVNRLHRFTSLAIKVPITGAYTLAAWSYDEHYPNRRDLVLALARNVIRPNIEALLNQGVEWIQIDEPAATTVPGEVPLFVESFNESVKDLVGKFSVHICFSDYSLLFPHVEQLDNCSQFSLEFANRDSQDRGTDTANRPAYDILREFQHHCPETAIGLGVTSVHDDHIETPELVRDRILRAVDIAGDPSLIYPSPDCGLRTRSWDVAFAKLQATVEGAKLAYEHIYT